MFQFLHSIRQRSMKRREETLQTERRRNQSQNHNVSLAMTITFVFCIVLFPAKLANFADACSVDSDCVPSTCCHPSSCVEKDRAPRCGDPKTCPAHDECTPFSLDCGGRCFCTALGECGAFVNLGNVGGQKNAAAGGGGDPNALYLPPPPPRQKRVKYTYGYIKVRGPAKRKKGY